jgi:anti-anti-sigma factor
VYLAQDESAGRQVAIKVPKGRPPGTAEGTEQFLSEARNVSRLRHEGIVALYDHGQEAEGSCYLVYEYVEGMTLAARLVEGPLPHEEAALIVARVAEALHHAHLCGLVHRDIKPSNILLDREGWPRVLDFGLAVPEEDLPQQRGLLAGTLAYMAPEQVRREGHFIDGRADIFSLGIVLYELLCGRRPFQGGTAEEVVEQILHREPKPPRQIRDSVPLTLERICLMALRKQIGERFTTAKDMAEELRRAVSFGPRCGYLQVQDRKGILILEVTSSVTAVENVDDFKNELYGLLETINPTQAVLDFAGTNHVPSATAGHLVSARRRLKDRGGELHICGLGEKPAAMFRETHLDRILKVYPDVAGALRAAGTQGEPQAGEKREESQGG